MERKEKTSSRWVRVTKETITETTFTSTGLTEGTEYQFRAYAENLAGPGPASEPSDLQKAKLPFGKDPEISLKKLNQVFGHSRKQKKTTQNPCFYRLLQNEIKTFLCRGFVRG